MFTRRAGIALAVAGIVAAAAPAMAQDSWPENPVKLIVPYGAGGAADTLARTVGHELSQIFGEQFVVENLTGAGGTIALTELSRSEPDGYTFGINNISTTVIAPVINDAVTYDPIEDFDYVALLGGSPTVFAASAELGIDSIEALAELAKASDRPTGYGSPGNGTLSHLIALDYWAKEGIEMIHFPYKGADAAMLDVVGGHIPFVSSTLSTAKPFLDAGQAVPLAISSPERDPGYPDVPTFAELGYPELTSSTWFGMVAPKGTDPAIIAKLNATINEVLAMPSVIEQLAPRGFQGELLSPEEYLAYQISQTEVFAPIAEKARTE